MMLKLLTKSFFRKSKKEELFSYNLIGKTTVISGDIYSDLDDFRIEGRINGELKAKFKIVISTTAFINGLLKRNKIVSLGYVNGEIIADNLELNKTSKTSGKITAKSIKIKKDAFFEGTMKMSD